MDNLIDAKNISNREIFILRKFIESEIKLSMPYIIALKNKLIRLNNSFDFIALFIKGVLIYFWICRRTSWSYFTCIFSTLGRSSSGCWGKYQPSEFSGLHKSYAIGDMRLTISSKSVNRRLSFIWYSAERLSATST